MFRALMVLVLLVCTSASLAFQPRTGHWWNPNESGTGYNIDIQDGRYVVTIYSYTTTGSAQWYLAVGPSTNGGRNFTATLGKYQGGQCISCPYAGMPTSIGNDGTISIVFTTETSATLTRPGGRITTIQPFNYGFGDPPQGLLGEWVFVYDIISTWADRFNYTSTAAGTANGNGLALDWTRYCACELQNTPPSLAGTVICADIDAAGNLENGYEFKFGLDETFNGYWISPTTWNEYAMKGFKEKSKSGYTKDSNQTGSRPESDAVKAAESARAGGEKALPEVIEAVRSLAGRLAASPMN